MMDHAEITRQEVVEAEKRLLAAQRAGNVAVLEQLLHDDLVGLSPTGELITKEMDLAPYKAGSLVLEEAVTEIERIRITGTVAVAVVSMKAKGKLQDAPIEGQFRYLRVWKRVAGTLKIVGASFLQLS